MRYLLFTFAILLAMFLNMVWEAEVQEQSRAYLLEDKDK